MKQLLLSITMLATLAGQASADCICNRLPCFCVQSTCKTKICPIQIDPLAHLI